MITLHWVYALMGAVFAGYALLGAADRSNPRRFTTAAFWALLALSMWAGDRIGDIGNGVLVLGLVAIAGFKGLGRGSGGVPLAERQARADRHGNGLFAIALVIPVTALAGTFLFKAFPAWIDPKQTTLISLALGVLIALAIGCTWLRARPIVALQQGRQLMDSVGWVAILPQMLARAASAAGSVRATAEHRRPRGRRDVRIRGSRRRRCACRVLRPPGARCARRTR